MPSRARSAVVIPDIGLPPNAPCQAPFFLLSPPALKQATNAFFLLGDSSAIGACRSPGARTDTEEGQIVSLREAGSTALPLRLVMSAPFGMTKAPSAAAEATIIRLEHWERVAKMPDQQKRKITHRSSTAVHRNIYCGAPSHFSPPEADYGK
jgi:hypothetical protein